MQRSLTTRRRHGFIHHVAVAKLVDAAAFHAASSRSAGSIPVGDTIEKPFPEKEMRISRKNEEMKHRLLRERDLLLREKEAIENRIIGIERAIALIGEDETSEISSAGRGRRTATKGVILGLLKDVGTTGLDAASAVELANGRGVTLDRASVSSLLSRLKKDEIVTYDGEKYRLTEFTKSPTTPLWGHSATTVVGMPKRG
jgi:hypothetical protein